MAYKIKEIKPFSGIDLLYVCTKKDEDFIDQCQTIITQIKSVHTNLSIPIQKHSNNVVFATSSGIYQNCDGIISNTKFDIIISLSVADCVPVCVFDSKTNNYGLIHSGWKGTSKKISNKAVELMQSNGSDIKDIKFYLGPSISQENYEVGNEVASLFSNSSYIRIGKKFLLDIKLQIRDDLVDIGIKEKNISLSSSCTYKNLNLPSFRRDGKNSGRMIFLMGRLYG